jgi:hypothetical protein
LNSDYSDRLLGEALSEISAARWRQSERAKADDGSAARGHLSRTLLLIRTLTNTCCVPPVAFRTYLINRPAG